MWVKVLCKLPDGRDLMWRKLGLPLVGKALLSKSLIQFFCSWVGLCSLPVSESENEVAQLCPTLCDPWTVAHQAPPSMGFSRQEYWSGLPFSSPGDLPDPGIEPSSPTLQADYLLSEPPGKPNKCCLVTKSCPTLLQPHGQIGRAHV